MKYIFVTGGVVSSLGKGLTAASLGTLLENRGLKVALQKFDPYLNVDPGTMNPYQHGEVYVLDDGAETDLDLGHYERFTNCKLTRLNNLTSGQVYQTVLNNERQGKYLGKTVQVIPHVTNEIQNRIHQLAEQTKADVIITEIGGTTGDIEGLPFLEAIREFALEVGHHNAIFVHVTYVPFIKAAGELKTKPTQQSVAKLREIGITPHILVCRCEKPLDKELRQKISLFCNVPYEAVIEEKDVDHTIYEVPLMLQRERVDDLVCRLLHLDTPQPNMAHWQEIIRKLIAPRHRVRIGVVGKYIELQDAYKSVYEAIIHGGVANDCGRSSGTGPKNCCRVWAASWSPAGSASVASRGKSRLPAMPGKTTCLIWACAWACKWPPSNSRATSSSSPRPTRPNSTRTRPIPSSPCWTSKPESPKKGAPCGSAHSRAS